MTAEHDTGRDERTLVIRRPTSRLLRPLVRSLLWIVVVAVAGVVAGTSPWALYFGVAMAGVIVASTAVAAIYLARSGWQLRLDAVGLTVPGRPTVPWSALSAVRITHLAVARRINWPGTVTAIFLPQPGLQLPALGVAGRRYAPRQSAARIGRYDTNLVVYVSVTDATTDDLIAAIQSFTDLPIIKQELGWQQ